MSEFARPEKLDTIGTADRMVEIAAGAAERAALAERFGLVSVERLAATFTIRREPAGIAARGRVIADVTQACTATGDPVAAQIDEPVALLFVEPGTGGDEVELDAGALDTIEIEGAAIDLGEAAAETMALAIDPFPRSPGAADALAAAGVIGEEDAKPTGALAGLKDLLSKKG